jgi:hypothetical protein
LTDGELTGAAGVSARTAHAALLGGSSEPKLGNLPAAASLVRRLGSSVSFVLLLDAQRFLPPDTSDKAQAGLTAVAYGKTRTGSSDTGWLTIEMPAAAVFSLISPRP